MRRKGERGKTMSLYLTVGLAVWLWLGALPATEGFRASDHPRQVPEHIRRTFNNLIRRVHKEQWVIGYVYMDNCPPWSRKNGQAIEEAITKSLNAWLQPVRDLNTGKPVVADFRYEHKLEIALADFKLYDLRIYFYCDFDKSHASVLADEDHPPALLMHRGTRVDDQFAYSLLHEIGHAFGLLDTYIRPHLTLEELRVSRGGLARTIGHHPASIMAGWNVPRPVGSAVSQDDANGIVWLYKFYHEDLALEDCIFPDYELEQSPDGCRPKYPLLFEIKHNFEERYAIFVIDEDENTDVNAKDGDGMTALQYAVKKGYPKLVDRLLAFENIEVNLQDGNGLTALHHAVLERNQQAVRALLAHRDIDVNLQDSDGLTALHHAVLEKNQQAMEALLGRKGLAVNSQDGDGLTVLHHAVMQRDPDTVKALLGHVGIDVEVKDGQGRTALDLANALEYKEIVQSLAVNPKGKLTTLWGRLKQMD